MRQLYTLIVAVCIYIALLSPNTATVAQECKPYMYGVQIELDDVYACPGEVISIPVRLKYNQLRGGGIADISFEFALPDTNLVEPVFKEGTREPLITNLHPDLAAKGSIRNIGYPRDEIRLVYTADNYDNLGVVKPNEIIFNVNLRLKRSLGEPLNLNWDAEKEISLSWKCLDGTVPLGGFPIIKYTSYSYRTAYIHPRSVPTVEINRDTSAIHKYRHVPMYPGSEAAFGLCKGFPLQIHAEGVAKTPLQYRWELVPASDDFNGFFLGQYDSTEVSHEQGLRTIASHNQVFFNNQNVQSPIVGAYPYLTKNFAKICVRAYEANGCAGYDTVIAIIQTDFSVGLKVDSLPTSVREDDVIQIKTILSDQLDYISKTVHVNPSYYPVEVSWYPEYLFRDNHAWSPITYPITEPTEISATVTMGYGCRTTRTYFIDVNGDSLYGKIDRPKHVCDIGNQQISVSALIKGGYDKKTYNWEFTPLYTVNGNAPLFSNPTGRETMLTLAGRTAIKLTVYDDSLKKSLILYDTLEMTQVTPTSLSIDYTPDTRKFLDSVEYFCNGEYPVRIEAKTENLGLIGYIDWEINGYKHPTEHGTMYAHPLMNSNALRTVKATMYSSVVCPSQAKIESQVIAVPMLYWGIAGLNIQNATEATCNDDSAVLKLLPVSSGINKYSIYRNNELYEEFIHQGGESEILHKVKSENYFDKFNVSITIINERCAHYNGFMPNTTIYPAQKTTARPQNISIVSETGNDTLCGLSSLRLTNINQISADANIIWMINDKEWGRYDYLGGGGFEPSPPTYTGAMHLLQESTALNGRDALMAGFPFHLGQTGFPTVGVELNPGDSVWAIIVTSTNCNGYNEIFTDTVPAFKPKFLPNLNITDFSIAGPSNLCEENSVTYFGAGSPLFRPNIQTSAFDKSFLTLNWYVNNKLAAKNTSFDSVMFNVSTSAGFTPTAILQSVNLKNGDSLYAVLESKYSRCFSSSTFPVKSNQIKVAVFGRNNRTNPTAGHPNYRNLSYYIPRDTVVCYNTTFAPLQIKDPSSWQTTFAVDLWTSTNSANTISVKNRYISTVTIKGEGDIILRNMVAGFPNSSGNGVTACPFYDTMSVRIAPSIEVGAELSISTDTIICTGSPVTFSVNPVNLDADAEYAISWYKNDVLLPGNETSFTTNNITNGDNFYCTLKANVFSCKFHDVVRSNNFKFKTNLPHFTAEANADKNILCGPDTAFIFAAGGSFYKWYIASSNTVISTDIGFDVSPKSTTVYKVKIYDADNACSRTDTVMVSVDEYKQVQNHLVINGRDTAGFCEGEDSVFVFTSQTQNTGIMPNYLWTVNGEILLGANGNNITQSLTDGSTVKSEVFASSDLITCAATSAVSELITVARMEKPKNTSTTGDTALCPENSSVISASGGDTYEWIPATGLSSATISNPTASPENSTRYAVKIIGLNKCFVIDTVVVDVYPDPGVLNANVMAIKDSICSGDTMTFVANSNHIGKIEWFVNGISKAMSDNYKYIPQNGDNISYKIISDVACLPNNTAIATDYSPKVLDVFVQIPDTLHVCWGYDTVINTVSNAENFYWPVLQALEPNGRYVKNPRVKLTSPFIRYIVEASTLNCVKRDSVLMLMHVRPVQPVISDQTICKDATVDIPVLDSAKNSTITYNPNYPFFSNKIIQYLWYTDTNADIIHVGSVLSNVTEGTYYLRGIGIDGCPTLDFAISRVIKGDVPEADYDFSEEEIIVQEEFLVQNNSVNWDTAYWFIGDTFMLNNLSSFSYSFDKIGTYSVMLIAVNNTQCKDTMQKVITVEPFFVDIYIPTAFTPTASNEEDKVFKIYGESILTAGIQISSLSGTVMYNTDDVITNGWDGTHQGNAMPAGNYNYVATIKLKDNNTVVRSGVVALIR